MDERLKIAILGGGPTGLLMFKNLIRSGQAGLSIDIFEKNQYLGQGMPYGELGATDEHITNVSGNEIPDMSDSLADWVKAADRGLLKRFDLDPEHFHEYKTLPRILFGYYLGDQFRQLIAEASAADIHVTLRLGSTVVDLADNPVDDVVVVSTLTGEVLQYQKVIICTGHYWPIRYEGKVNGYYDSPYPPSKLSGRFNHPVAIKGASLTAIDAIRTLARANGKFFHSNEGELVFERSAESPEFSMLIHSRNGLLPAVRFHLKDPFPAKHAALDQAEILQGREANDGFLPLDYVYEKCFLNPLKAQQPDFYESIKDLNMEDFVGRMMDLREEFPPFELLAMEFREAHLSIAGERPIHWKEMLANLSFAMNYPAKYFSAEDMQRLKTTLMPFVSVIIAFTPQTSVEELLALHRAGVLDIVAVGEDSDIRVNEETGGVIYVYTDASGDRIAQFFETFIDAVGQPHLSWKELPYQTLLAQEIISPATLKFRDRQTGEREMNAGDQDVSRVADDYYLSVPGVRINDNFQLVNGKGEVNDRIFMMAVPYIGGYNPDYSGLDFGEVASKMIVKKFFGK